MKKFYNPWARSAAQARKKYRKISNKRSPPPPIWTLKMIISWTFISKIQASNKRPLENNGEKRSYILQYVAKFIVQSPKEEVCFYFRKPNKL